MGGDGVSMPTVLSQLGNVAKTLARNQQAANTAGSSLATHEKEELQDLKKIPKTQKAEKQTLERRRDRSRRGKPDATKPFDETEVEASSEDPDADERDEARAEPIIGALIDRKA